MPEQCPIIEIPFVNLKKSRPDVIYSGHHSSHAFREYSWRSALTHRERVERSDYGTSVTIPRNGLASLLATYSRSIIDLNRGPNHPNLFVTEQSYLGRWEKIWKADLAPTEAEKTEIFNRIWLGYHNRLLAKMQAFSRPGFVVAWDNTEKNTIDTNDQGENQEMQTIILSNKGRQDSADNPDDITTCEPALLRVVAHNIERALRSHNLPHQVRLNLVYKGGYVAEHSNTRRHPDLDVSQPIQSFQIEYITSLTHNQETLAPNYPMMHKLRAIFEGVMWESLA